MFLSTYTAAYYNRDITRHQNAANKAGRLKHMPLYLCAPVYRALRFRAQNGDVGRLGDVRDKSSRQLPLAITVDRARGQRHDGGSPMPSSDPCRGALSRVALPGSRRVVIAAANPCVRTLIKRFPPWPDPNGRLTDPNFLESRRRLFFGGECRPGLCSFAASSGSPPEIAVNTREKMPGDFVHFYRVRIYRG